MVEREVEGVDAVADLLGRWPVLWLNVDGLGDAGTIAEPDRLVIGEIHAAKRDLLTLRRAVWPLR
ncbi:MAG: hypothetical protein ACREKI_01460, partial [Gemmatimonadota bacterium]